MSQDIGNGDKAQPPHYEARALLVYSSISMSTHDVLYSLRCALFPIFTTMTPNPLVPKLETPAVEEDNQQTLVESQGTWP